MSEPKLCSICKKEYYGWGNNALPVMHGQCCEICNTTMVIPARLKSLFSVVEDKNEEKAD